MEYSETILNNYFAIAHLEKKNAQLRRSEL